MKTEAAVERSVAMMARHGSELRRGLHDMDAFSDLIEGRPMEAHLRNLAASVDRIGSVFPRQPVRYPFYGEQWAAFLGGRRKNLDAAAVRYLCWEPAVATDERFMRYLITCGVRLKRRPLAGLVRSFHRAWRERGTKKLLEAARALLLSYDGPSPLICKWRSGVEYILSERGPEMLGLLLADRGGPLAPFLDEWCLDRRSSFVTDVVEATAEACGVRLGAPTRSSIEFLFGELLPWPGWEPYRLRLQVARLVLESSMTGQVREILQRFILLSEHLGDPRIEENRSKWSDVPPKARDRVVLWLTRNPFGLLEQVYREGRGWVTRPWGERTGVHDSTGSAEA